MFSKRQKIMPAESECVEAFEKGNKQDAERLLPLLAGPAEVRTTGPGEKWVDNQVSLLHLAAGKGWMDIVIDLITKYKCDASHENCDGYTALHYAASCNHLEVVRYLINEQHCDPMTGSDIGSTPLHIACSNDHFNIIQYLIEEAHCSPLCMNRFTVTPLHRAFQNGNIHTVQYILCSGIVNSLETEYSKESKKRLTRSLSSLEYAWNKPKSFLHMAAANGWVDITIVLITKYKCKPSSIDQEGHTPLHYAVIKNHLEVVRYLINEQHCDLTTTTNTRTTKTTKCETALHLACRCGHLNITQYLIKEAHRNPSCENNDGDTPLHIACREGHFNLSQYLIREAHCNTSCENNDGNIPLHLACCKGHFNLAYYLIRKVNSNPSCKNSNGNTPLHYACSNGHLNIAQYLIREEHCNPTHENSNGVTPLYIAYHNGHLGIARYFIRDQNSIRYLIRKAHCYTPNDRDTILSASYESYCHIIEKIKSTTMIDKQIRPPLLQLAAAYGWMDIVIDLITKYKCDTNCRDSCGHTPLHYAASNNHLEVVKYLINEQNCDPMTTNNINETPLHHACYFDRLSIAKYLIDKAHCNPSCEDRNGNTPLHLACDQKCPKIAQYLLSTGKVDPEAKNKEGKTPLDIATKTHIYSLLKPFQSFSQCERDFPVHTYTKLILTGHSGAGKTTMSQLILFLANKQETDFSSGHVTNVECLTAGIIPIHVKSKVNEVGNMVIYDFAGQQEYYSSHAAVLELIMRNSAAIFACIVDLSQCRENISESIHYWISFIENSCSSAQGSSHVIIVGSHADLIESSRELKEKSSLVETIAKSRVKQLTYGGFVSMDCRESKTKEARGFCSVLSTSQQAILSSQPSMSLYCHVLYAFLRTKLGVTGCTLQKLNSTINSEKDLFLDSTVLSELLTSLSDKGLILFVENHEHSQSSWVVVEKEALLREVNGTLFAPDHCKQYRQVASNTGIVPIITLEDLFPQYSSKMLVGCLESMEFCHPVDPSALQDTNLKPTLPFLLEAKYLFFPSLIKEHRPGDLMYPRFGWCLGCSEPHQFFSNRFLHVLLLRLAFTFSLASKTRSLTPSLRGLERQCEVWQNGICWKNVSGVSTIVEIIDLNRWVILLVSEKTREAAQTCSSVIRMILDLQHQLCSTAVTTCECLISPSLLDRYPFDALPDNELFDLPSVARSMLLHHKILLDLKDGKNEFLTNEALSCEPYYLLQPSSVCKLFDQKMASESVPDPLFQEVLSYCKLTCQKPRDLNELSEYVNKHSIFAGRNPLVSSVHAVQ